MKRQTFLAGVTTSVALAPRAGLAAATVRLATLVPSALTWLHHVAEAQGFYRDAGLTVENLVISDSPGLLQAVASGSADVGFSLGDLALIAIDQRAPIVMTGAVLDRSALRLIGGPGIKSARDLNGKRVTAGALRGGTTNLMLYQLKLLSVNIDSLQVVSIPNSRDRVVAMQNGQVSGAMLLAPFDIVALQQKMTVLDVYRQPYVETPVIFNVNWAQKNRKTAIAMAHSLRRAALWINQTSNRAAAAQILAHATNATHDIADASYRFIVAEQHAIPRDLSIPENGLRDILRINQVIEGKAPPPFTFHEYYDPSFLASPS
jgi:ABC-type nitrate/sulfonate/bicarbonate transport system substrate-binding protein